MSRTLLPFHAGDISALARSLRGQLAEHERTPGHVELLNMLARSTGFRNFQHFRTQSDASDHLASPAPLPEPVDHVRVKRIARYFDDSGRLIRWPGKFSHREPCLWALWSQLPPKREFSEGQINQLLRENHLFDDPALLRRELVDNAMVERTPDCRVYRRIERRPPPDALVLIRHLASRRSG